MSKPAAPPTKRFTFEMSEQTYDQLKELADAEHRPVSDILKRFVGLGLRLSQISKNPGSGVWLRESGDAELERVMFY